MNDIVKCIQMFSLLTVLAVGGAWAQLHSGNLYGTITDTEGQPLLGVAVTVSGVGAALTQQTNEQGQVRFLGLDPGTYEIEAKQDGLTTVRYQGVIVQVGRNATMQLQMSKALEETITVTTEPPLLRARNGTRGLTVNSFEIESLPTTRDSWSIVSQAPGVLMDRVNVGGIESGQQSVFVGSAASAENVYMLDGVNITDMAAIGASPAYYDIGQFEQVDVVVGGTDISLGSAGVMVQMVTKRGTNEWRGSGNLFWTPENLQAESPLGPDVFPDVQGQSTTDRLRGLTEVGVEGGGPLIRNRLWGWASYADQDINRDAVGGQRDDVDLDYGLLKLNSQVTPTNAASLSWNSGSKDRYGRGAADSRSEESLWDQNNDTDLFNFEMTQQVSSGLSLHGGLASFSGDFSLVPRGGSESEIVLGSDGLWHGGFFTNYDQRDSEQATFESTQFFGAGKLSHQLQMGTTYRRFDYGNQDTYGARNVVQLAAENFDRELDFLEAYRHLDLQVAQRYRTLWGQDTIAGGRTTVTLGLRYDGQSAATQPSRALANPVFPDLLPTLDVPGVDAGFDWNTFSPRVGVAYDVKGDGTLLLRSGFARYPSQLHTTMAIRVTPYAESGAFFEFSDSNGDEIYQVGEPIHLLSYFGVGAGEAKSANVNADNLSPETTSELSLGIEGQLGKQLTWGVDLVGRTLKDVLESRAYVNDGSTVRLANHLDYEPGATPTSVKLPRGVTSEVQVYSLAPSLDYTGGRLLVNGDRSQDYRSLTLRMARRFDGRWMAQAHVHLNDWQWHIGEQFRFYDDPTNAAISFADDGLVLSADSDGDVVAEPFRGLRDGIYLNSRWSANFNGAVDIARRKPWGFRLGAVISGREGYPLPYRVNVLGRDGQLREVQVTDTSDSFRYDDLWLTDLKLDKELAALGLRWNLSLDVFNLWNSGEVLERSVQLNGPRPNFLQKTLNPRVLRLGLRIGW